MNLKDVFKNSIAYQNQYKIGVTKCIKLTKKDVTELNPKFEINKGGYKLLIRTPKSRAEIIFVYFVGNSIFVNEIEVNSLDDVVDYALAMG